MQLGRLFLLQQRNRWKTMLFTYIDWHFTVSAFDDLNWFMNSYGSLILPDRLGKLSAPSLVADSVTNTTLSLQWNLTSTTLAIGLKPDKVNCSLQWSYSSYSASSSLDGHQQVASTWQYVARMNRSADQSRFHVDGLRPFTTYRVSSEIFVSSGSARWSRRCWISSLCVVPIAGLSGCREGTFDHRVDRRHQNLSVANSSQWYAHHTRR